MGIREGDSVLDIGSGVGGPGRDIMRRYGCNVAGINISLEQSKAHQQLSRYADPHARYLAVALGDMQYIPVRDNSFNHAIAINMFYHVPNPGRAITEVARVLEPGGNFGLDDWFVTPEATERSINRLRYLWSAPTTGFHNIQDTKRQLTGVGLHVVEELDYSEEAGEFLSEDRFGRVFDAQVATQLRQDFPKLYKYPGYKPEHADTAVRELREAALFMGDLYRSEQAVYRQLIAEKL